MSNTSTNNPFISLNFPLRIVLLYSVGATVWILFSDSLLYALFTVDIERLPAFSILKGMLFVVVTSIFLYLLLWREFTLRQAKEAHLEAEIQRALAYQTELENSEHRFRRAVEEAPVPIIMFADDGEVLSLSRTWLDLTGYTAEQLPTIASWTALAYGERQEVVQEIIERLFELDGRVDEGEFTVRCVDGSLLTWLFSSTPLGELPDGRRVVISIVADMTERKLLEAKARQKEGSFRLLFANNPQPMWVYDQETLAFLEVNDAAVAHYGYSREEFLNMTIMDIRPPQDRVRLREHLARPRGGLSEPSVWQHWTKNGRVIQVEIRAHALEFVGRQASLVVALDVTERQQMENALRESERRFRQIAENIEEVFYLNDSQKRETFYVSPAYEKIWGRSVQSLYEKPDSFLEAIHPDDRAQVVDSFVVQRAGQPTEVTYRVIRPEGSVRWVRSRAFPVWSERGELVRIAGLAEDITAFKWQEGELRRLAQQLVAVQELERRQIARELHDEIGQTLTSLSLSLEMLGRNTAVSTPTLTTEIAALQEILQALMKRVRQISLDLRPAMLDDLGLLPALRWLLNQYTERTGIRVDFRQSGLEKVRANQELNTAVYRIIQESLTNIARHAQVTEAVVDLWANDEKLIVQISDEGQGFDITQLNQERLAVGLLGMRERARTLGGDFLIESSHGRGTQVVAEIPL